MIGFLRAYLEASALLAAGALALAAATRLARGDLARTPGRWLGVAALWLVVALAAPPLVRAVAPPAARSPAVILWSKGVESRSAIDATSIALAARGADEGRPTLVVRDRQLACAGWLLAACALLLAVRLGRQTRRLARLCASLPVVRRQGRLLLCATDDPSSPFSARVGRRSYIAVPTALWTDLRQVRMVVAHEGAHLRRRDHAAAFALELLKLAFFWNPAAHGWARLVHALQEIACDRAVSRRFGATAYGRCLLRAAELGRQPLYRLEGGLPMARGPGLLTRRVTMLMMGGRVTRRSAVLAAAVALVGVAALAGLARAAATAVADRRVDRAAVQAMADRLHADTGFAVPVDDWVTAKLNELVGPRRAWTRQAFDRLAPVRAEIEGQLAAAGLPRELLAVPFAESGFDAGAVSSHGSAGVWQLMPQTARRYGLQVSDTRDDRRSVGAATTAAAALLRDLHGTFGEWPLAIAAYNCGRGRALAAVDEVGSRDLATLARSGHLGQDARNGYVQTVLAAVLLLHDPRLMD